MDTPTEGSKIRPIRNDEFTLRFYERAGFEGDVKMGFVAEP